MTKSKPHFESKLIWLGLFQVVFSSQDLITTFITNGDFSPSTIFTFLAGILTIAFRIMSTTTIK